MSFEEREDPVSGRMRSREDAGLPPNFLSLQLLVAGALSFLGEFIILGVGGAGAVGHNGGIKEAVWKCWMRLILLPGMIKKMRWE